MRHMHFDHKRTLFNMDNTIFSLTYSMGLKPEQGAPPTHFNRWRYRSRESVENLVRTGRSTANRRRSLADRIDEYCYNNENLVKNISLSSFALIYWLAPTENADQFKIRN